MIEFTFAGGWCRGIVLCLIIIGFIADIGGSSTVDACPARCRCEQVQVPRTIDCSDGGSEAISGYANGFLQIEKLNLSRNRLTSLPIYVFKLTQLQILNLSSNKLTKLPTNFSNLVNLRELDLSENLFESPDNLAVLKHLPRLKTLYLTGNPLGRLDGVSSVSLKFLKANSCGIRKLIKRSLAGLSQLVQLNLADNPLEEINEPYCLTLKVLDLSKCRLNVLSSRTFEGFPELIELRLADNPKLVYSYSNETLQHSKLQKIDVSRCGLDRPGLYGLPSLTHAKLSGNVIGYLPNRIFYKNHALAHLYLDSNRLEKLNQSTFANLKNLQVLDLSANSLQFILSSTFKDNVALEFLKLSDNDFTNFPKIWSKIVKLDLSSNNISKLDSDILFDLTNLRHLDLSANNFKETPRSVVSESLKVLDLKSNYIETIHNDTFSELPRLEVVDISDNLLVEAISPSLFDNNPYLQQLHLHDNPWLCDCQKLRSIQHLLTSLHVDQESLICNRPISVSGYTWRLACANDWKKNLAPPAQKSTYKLILLGVLILAIACAAIVSIRHTRRLKREARNHRIEMEVAEARERLRFLRRRNQHLDDELQTAASEPRIHPLELLGPPSYEEALTMTRLARSLDTLQDTTVTESNQTAAVQRIAASSESLGKKRQRSRRTGNLARDMRRKERLRRTLESVAMVETEDGSPANNRTSRPPTPAATKRKSKRLSAASIKARDTLTDDDERKSGYVPSTESEN